MRDLSTIRDAWPAMDAEETRLLRQMSVTESLRLFSMLYEAFAPRFREEAGYLQEREAAAVDLRRKMVRLAQQLKEA